MTEKVSSDDCFGNLFFSTNVKWPYLRSNKNEKTPTCYYRKVCRLGGVNFLRNTIFRLLKKKGFLVSTDCNMKGIYGIGNEVISVDTIADGCQTDFVMKNGAQVHILNLHFSLEVRPVSTLIIHIINCYDYHQCCSLKKEVMPYFL